MAAKTTQYATDLLKLVLNATNYTNIATSTGLTSVYISLHTGNPGASGLQNTSECSYTSYGRIAVARTTGGFTVASGSASPISTIVFPAATGGSETATYFGIGASTSGSGILYYFGSISPSIVITNGVTPEILNTSTITES